MNSSRAVRIFMASVAVLLLGTALAKLVSALGHARVLQATDPVLGVSYRTTLLMAASIEGLIVLALIWLDTPWVKMGLICAVATGFTAYRIIFWAIGSPSPCPCLGTITDALSIPRPVIEWCLKGMIAYLFAGSAYALLRADGVMRSGLKDSSGPTKS